MNKKILKKMGKIALRSLIVLLVTVAILVAGLWCAMYFTVNGPSPTAGKLLILSLKETSAAGFLADWFMTEEEIAALMGDDEGISEDINTGLIDIPRGDDTDDATNPPETGDEPITDTPDKQDDGVEFAQVKGPTYNGIMMIVKDPTRVFVGTPAKYGEGQKGLTLSQMIDRYDAVGGTNGGGFFDEAGTGTGGIPEGIVISEGKLLWGDRGSYYSLAGIDSNGILHVGKMTGEKALSLGIKYACSYGPALIINGVPCNEKRSLGGGLNPRTAIGQRADGAILMLVVNGRKVDSLGATLDDLVEIMLSFGAVNASNLDGGSSSLMKYDGEFKNTSSYIYGGERVLPTAILVRRRDAK